MAVLLKLRFREPGSAHSHNLTPTRKHLLLPCQYSLCNLQGSVQSESGGSLAQNVSDSENSKSRVLPQAQRMWHAQKAGPAPCLGSSWKNLEALDHFISKVLINKIFLNLLHSGFSALVPRYLFCITRPWKLQHWGWPSFTGHLEATAQLLCQPLHLHWMKSLQDPWMCMCSWPPRDLAQMCKLSSGPTMSSLQLFRGRGFGSFQVQTSLHLLWCWQELMSKQHPILNSLS